jgi:quinoprotein glucose dehydrogenase
MSNTPEPNAAPRRFWPLLLLAAVVIAVGLAVLWVSSEVRRVKRFQRIAARTRPAPQVTNVVLSEFRELLTGGDAAAGRKVFFEKPEAKCVKCHRIGEAGANVGPALDGIGAKQSREQILESIISPNARIREGYESVILILKSGGTASGVLKKVTETELVVDSADEGTRAINRADVQSRRPAMSPMPERLWLVLSRAELRDLVEYLAIVK